MNISPVGIAACTHWTDRSVLERQELPCGVGHVALHSQGD
jgi:hypothetical protein